MKSDIVLLLTVVAAAVAVTHAATISTFPYASCTKRPSPYSLSALAQTPSLNTLCFKVQVSTPANCTSYCCTSADVRKILIDVNADCFVSNPNMNATINGLPTKVGPGLEPGVNGPDNSYVLRLTQLGLNQTNANDVEICISLGLNSMGRGCPTTTALCKPPAGSPNGTCAAALFDVQNDCCPISQISPSTSPPPPPPLNTTLSSTEPCTVCASLNLYSSYKPYFPQPVTFKPTDCIAWSSKVVSDFSKLALDKNVSLVDEDPVVKCTSSKLQVCSVLKDKADAAKLQEGLQFALQMWYGASVNPCKSYFRGPYRVYAEINNGMDSSGCLNSRFEVVCDPLPVTFPTYNCLTSIGATPFYALPFLEELPGSKNTTTSYCFTTFTGPVDVGIQDACAQSTNLLKAEIYADDQAYRRKIKGIRVTPAGSNVTRHMAPSWAAQGDQTLKVSNLNWNLTQADGGKICMEMEKDFNVGEFCMSPASQNCKIILFDDTKDCCPRFEAST